jgi:predicted glutamine amidotransferase
MAYMGSPIIIDKLLYQPKNSLINQSINARELEEPLNGDGFGIGWYVAEVNYEPVTFVSINPAWSNRNLRNLAPKIRTECFIAHVRAASVGEVSESNCHPFQYKNLLMMHNGGVENFGSIKRQIREPLNDEFYNWIKGQTDSEHLFALLLNYLYQEASTVSAESVMNAFERMFDHLDRLMKEHDINEPAYLNMVVTNGLFVVGTRFVTKPRESPLTLYHSKASQYAVENGVGQIMPAAGDDKSVLIVSEKLSDEKDWIVVPPNHFVVVDNELDISTRPIKSCANN